MPDIRTILESIEEDSSVIDINNDGLSLVSLLLDIAETNIESEDCIQAVETIEKIFNSNHKTAKITSVFSRRISSLGMAAYRVKNFIVAETAFKIIAESGDVSAKNNYAYMIRRHEIAVPSKREHVVALKILQEGVKEGDAFSLVNTALIFALMIGDDESWHLADAIFEKLSKFGGMLVCSWWVDVANDGDIEGFLVHYFLLRHKKIDKSDLGDKEQLSKKLSEEIEGFPEWLIVQPRFKSLDDVFDAMLEEDFDDSLTKYLNNMPRTRKSAEEILEEMTQWDEWDLYKTLLQDYMEFLTPEEIRKTIRAYKKKFIMPLSSILDESVIKDLDQDSSEEQHDE